jgi:tRNA uridine 5-carbamoylmethylation protein Kti12
MIYLLYGQPASGKTTISKRLADYIRFKPQGYDPLIIDGDDLREVFQNKNYSKKGREDNIRKANTIATYFSKTDSGTTVILALVNPYEKIRQELIKDNPLQVKKILLKSKRDLRKEYHAKDFEEGMPDLILNTDKDIEENLRELIEFLDL